MAATASDLAAGSAHHFDDTGSRQAITVCRRGSPPAPQPSFEQLAEILETNMARPPMAPTPRIEKPVIAITFPDLLRFIRISPAARANGTSSGTVCKRCKTTDSGSSTIAANAFSCGPPKRESVRTGWDISEFAATSAAACGGIPTKTHAKTALLVPQTHIQCLFMTLRCRCR